uniref:Uncharacterized protein n=1 Tax=Ammonifex degensii TaxID=42838 RepID=A0A7C1JLT5_9THEO
MVAPIRIDDPGDNYQSLHPLRFFEQEQYPVQLTLYLQQKEMIFQERTVARNLKGEIVVGQSLFQSEKRGYHGTTPLSTEPEINVNPEERYQNPTNSDGEAAYFRKEKDDKDEHSSTERDREGEDHKHDKLNRYPWDWQVFFVRLVTAVTCFFVACGEVTVLFAAGVPLHPLILLQVHGLFVQKIIYHQAVFWVLGGVLFLTRAFPFLEDAWWTKRFPFATLLTALLALTLLLGASEAPCFLPLWIGLFFCYWGAFSLFLVYF